jgi:hypothetical protein
MFISSRRFLWFGSAFASALLAVYVGETREGYLVYLIPGSTYSPIRKKFGLSSDVSAT